MIDELRFYIDGARQMTVLPDGTTRETTAEDRESPEWKRLTENMERWAAEEALDAGPGWWHPRECIDLHDEDHNCLDSDGSIIGWRDPVTSAVLESTEARPDTIRESLISALRSQIAEWRQIPINEPDEEGRIPMEVEQGCADVIEDILAAVLADTGAR